MSLHSLLCLWMQMSLRKLLHQRLFSAQNIISIAWMLLYPH